MRRIAFLLLLTVFASCQYDPFAHLFLTQKPTNADVAGTYVFEKQTIGYDLKLAKIPRIVVKPDGTFTAVDFPNFKADSAWNFTFSGEVSFSGKWSVDSFGVVDSGFGTRPTYGIYLTGAPEHIATPQLTGYKKPDGLVFEFGDPDSGEAVVFRKM